jgi:hypothetical protein
VKQFIIAFIFTLGFVAGSDAATFYVAKTGTDSNSCAQAQNSNTPKSTIPAALACIGTALGAGAGHTVEVAAGTYTEYIGDDKIPSGTSWNSPFTLKAKSSDIVIIKPTGELIIRWTNYNTSQFAIIQGLRFDSANVWGTGISVGGCCDAPNDIRFQNIEMYGGNLNYIGVSRQSSRIDILKSKFHDLGSSPGAEPYPIYYGGSNGLIEGNEMYNIPAYGIHMYASGASSPMVSNNIVRNNLIRDFGQQMNTPAILLGVGSNNQAYNNILYNGKYGISSGNGAVDSKIFNNTIYNMAYVGVDTYNSAGTVVKNNVIYQTPQPINNAGMAAIISNNLTTDPKFVNPGTNDFRLQSGSSAIDSGADLALLGLTLDFANAVRPQGCCYDIGAYEYGSTAVVAPAVSAPSSAPTSPVPGITVDSTYSGFGISSIDDGVINAAGDIASTWASEASSTDHWVNIGFATPRQINTATIFWAFNNFQKKFMTANRLEVQYWDGLAFTNIGTIAYPGSDVSSSSVSFPTVTTSQLRFFMPAGEGNPSYPNILWLTEVNYGLNVVTVDSTFSGFSTASIDDGIINASGDIATTWASASSGSDHWVEIAFASPMQTNTATIHWAYNNYQQRFMTAKQLNVQYWDGSTYKTIATTSYSGSDVPSSSVVFPAVTTSRMRFFMPAGQGNPGYPDILWLTEVEYGLGNVVTPPAAPGTLIVSK